MTHSNEARCADLITETTRLRMAIDECEQVDGHQARLDAARLWVQYHRACVELLALTPAHDKDAATRQKRTADEHQALQDQWRAALARLEEEGEGASSA